MNLRVFAAILSTDGRFKQNQQKRNFIVDISSLNESVLIKIYFVISCVITFQVKVIIELKIKERSFRQGNMHEHLNYLFI